MTSGPFFDVVVLGGGIAGATIAAHLAPDSRVLILEREDHLGAHASGRSTGMLIPSYGGPVIQALAEESRTFFRHPPAEIGGALLEPRQVLHFGGRPGAMIAGDVRPLTTDEALALCPVLRSAAVGEAWLECGGGELDVARLHHGFITMAARRGASIWLGANVSIQGRWDDRWRLLVSGEAVSCRTIVNATGAWADEIGTQAGLSPLGLRSYRRTVVLVDAPEPASRALRVPIAKHLDERLYFRQLGPQLLVSAADETLTPPGDAAPDPVDVGLAMARLEEATTLTPSHVRHSWAGLRTFAPDRLPVVGWDRQAPGFFWMTGLGGFGIQTAPALGRLASAIFRNESAPSIPNLASPVEMFDPNRQRPAETAPAPVGDGSAGRGA